MDINKILSLNIPDIHPTYGGVRGKNMMIESMVKLFPEFCKRIDRGGFYIACAMGLHRTDIALCTKNTVGIGTTCTRKGYK